jgi:hypothetical protein
MNATLSRQVVDDRLPYARLVPRGGDGHTSTPRAFSHLAEPLWTGAVRAPAGTGASTFSAGTRDNSHLCYQRDLEEAARVPARSTAGL